MVLKTLVYQSAPAEGQRPAWIGRCLRSVENWAKDQGFTYRFYDDRFLELVPQDLVLRAKGRLQMVADVARLLLAQQLLHKEGWERVIWADADFLIFDPPALRLDAGRQRPPDLLDSNLSDQEQGAATDHRLAAYAFGQEIWVQPGVSTTAGARNSASQKGGWKVRHNVHNAFMVLGRDNPVLDYYCHTACRLLARQPLEGEARVPPQFLGPKLLGTLHSLTEFPLLPSAGAFSPDVMADLAKEEGTSGSALQAFSTAMTAPLGGANLCASLWPKDQAEALVDKVITRLLTEQQRLFNGEEDKETGDLTA
ncbi:hypothetical protein ACTL6U_07200 [Rhodovibrionaceae bacterium A322]